MDLQNESVFTLALKCSDKQLSPTEFVNLYKEFYNEKFAKIFEQEEEEGGTTNQQQHEPQEGTKKENIQLDNICASSNEKVDSTQLDDGQNSSIKKTESDVAVDNKNIHDDSVSTNTTNEREKLMNILSDDFVKIFNCDQPLLLADYVIEIIFINYDSDLIHAFMPKLTTVNLSSNSSTMLIYFFNRSCIYFDKLKDKIVIDSLNKDLSTVIVPNILNGRLLSSYGNNNNDNNNTNQFILALAKFLYSILRLSSNPIVIQTNQYKDNFITLMAQVFKINKLLHKKISSTLESKLIFKDLDSRSNKDNKLSQGSHLHSYTQQSLLPDFVTTPSLTSPQFIPSPSSTMKTPISNHSIHHTSTNKYTDMKLIRYYKNLWLNSKIMNWETFNDDFLSKYNSISSYVFHKPTTVINPQNNDTVLADLIETSFICFAQYVSNKQYHRSNSNLNLLERQWMIFICKHLPLLILKHCPENPQIVVNALESIDTKVIKAIKSYYSEKEDIRNRNEDLFDDFSVTSLDIRHDFIKSLIMLGLQPPTLINEFLREDQLIDPKTLQTTDEVIITTPQGSQESLSNITNFLLNSLNSLDFETIGNFNSEPTNGIQQLLNGFENIAPTKQREISLTIVNILHQAIEDCDHSKISKLCSLLAFNFSHSLTFIFTYCSPKGIIEMLMKFIDNLWDKSAKLKKEDGEDSEENNELSLSFSWVLLFLLSCYKNYNISLRDIALTSSNLKLEGSFCVKYLSNISEIPDDFSINVTDKQNTEVQAQSHSLVQGWLTDLFINGSLSDKLTNNTDTKQLAELLPFILKQVFYAIEINVINDINIVISGLEYFLQPFMIVGLLKIMFWFGEYLIYLYNESISDELLQKILTTINSIINPPTLNEDTKVFHTAVLRINAVSILSILRKFKERYTQSNYGVYSSDFQDRSILDLLIEKFTNVLNISPIYNIDPRVFLNDSMYSQQKPISYGKLLILNENPINKILANQINSFWNLHSSTYYNLDFLNEIIKLVTLKNFVYDVLETLDYKLATFGVPVARKKMSSIESEQVLEYFLYFLVLHDCESQWDAANMMSLLTENNNENNSNSIIKEGAMENEAIQPKTETIPDDDFDMLFGENETSTQGINNDILPIGMELEDNSKKLSKFSALKRDSFGVLLYELKPQQERAYNNKELSKEEYEKFNKIYNLYLNMLKTCVF